MESTKKTIIDNIKDRSKNHMKVKAFESIGGASIDYKTFFDIVDVYAKGFKKLGVKNGDMVTICAAGTLDTVLNFAALNKIGAVAQFVNPNYFKFNSKKYINDTNSKLMICLDRFYPLIKEAIGQTNVEKILLSSISEYSSWLFKIVARRKKVKEADKIKGVEYIDLPEFIRMGENSLINLEDIPYVQNKPAIVTYTSGTTGDPKGPIHTNDSINNMFSIYDKANGFGNKVGDRNLVLIPPMYLTSLVHSILAPMTLGATNILQPIYNPQTLGKDLKKYKPNAVVATKSHYLNLKNANLKKDSLSYLNFAYCGGEAISKTTAIKINDILADLGVGKMIIGYGQTEFGTMVMFNNELENRINESGKLLPGIQGKILDVVTGKEVQKGQRGELYIKSPATMIGYINNQEATDKFFVIDEDGEKWAKTGDIAEVKYQVDSKDVYDVTGRKNDSFIDEDGNVIYLFDIENKVEDVKLVDQAEVVAVTVDGKKVPVVHVVLDKNAKDLQEEMAKLIDDNLKTNTTNKNEIPYAYKFRDKFDLSPISGKRSYESLVYETDGYLRIDENGEVVSTEIISEESKNNNDIVRSKILMKDSI